MNIEEAGEIVLQGSPWAECDPCRGSGWTTHVVTDDGIAETGEPKSEREECWSCKSAGFFLPPDIEKAYQLLGVEPPPKPLTPRERIAKMTSNFIKRRLDETSVARRLFPALELKKP